MIKQIMTDATPQALTAALAAAAITVDSIIAIHYVETNEGSGPGRVRQQFRVLYEEGHADDDRGIERPADRVR